MERLCRRTISHMRHRIQTFDDTTLTTICEQNRAINHTLKRTASWVLKRCSLKTTDDWPTASHCEKDHCRDCASACRIASKSKAIHCAAIDSGIVLCCCLRLMIFLVSFGHPDEVLVKFLVRFGTYTDDLIHIERLVGQSFFYELAT